MKRSCFFVVALVLVLVVYCPGAPRVAHRGLFMDRERESRLLAYWPRTADPAFDRLRKQVSAYTEESMPQAFQFKGGFHSIYFNHAFIPSQQRALDPFGNGNREFPWGHPAGLCCDNEKTNWEVARFARITGMRWWDQVESGDRYTVWDYAPGTAFVEVLLVKDSAGTPFPFTVRLKEKRSTIWQDWADTVYQPFEDFTDLRKAALALGFNLGDMPPPVDAVLQSKHPTPAFSKQAMRGWLPAMPENVVRELLRDPVFKVATKAWPWSVKEGFSVQPTFYNGFALSPRNRTCRSCHEHTLVPADKFDSNREWYGRIRGSDGIISMHPLDPAGISTDGKDRERIFRPSLVESGILKHWQAGAQR